MDLSRFEVPNANLDPRDMNTIGIFALGDFISVSSTRNPSDPFVFRSKDQILSLLSPLHDVGGSEDEIQEDDGYRFLNTQPCKSPV